MQTEVKPQENSIGSKINFEFMNRSFSIQTKHLEKKIIAGQPSAGGGAKETTASRRAF